MPKTLNKYLVALKGNKKSLCVGAESPDDALALCFPDVVHSEEYNSGYGWVQFKVEPGINSAWPEGESDSTTNIIDVEKVGEIVVADTGEYE